MGLRVQLFLRFFIPLILTTSLVIGLSYYFTKDYEDLVRSQFRDYRSHIDDFYILQNDMFINISQNYILTAYSAVALSQNLLQNYLRNDLNVKTNFTGVENSYNYYHTSDILSQNHSVWNLNPCSTTYHSLIYHKDARNSLLYSGIVNTVMRPYIRGSEKYYSYIPEYVMGYDSDLFYSRKYNLNYSTDCTCIDYLYKSCSDPLDLSQQEWYNKMNEYLYDRIHIVNPYVSKISDGSELVLQRACGKFYSEYESIGGMCVGINSGEMIAYQYHHIYNGIEMLRTDSYVLNYEGYLSFYIGLNASFYDQIMLADVEFENFDDPNRLIFEQKLNKTVSQIRNGDTRPNQQFKYTGPNGNEKIATLNTIFKTYTDVIFVNTVENYRKSIEADKTEDAIYAVIQLVVLIYLSSLILLGAALFYLNLAIYELITLAVRDYAQQLRDIETGLRDGFTKNTVISCKEISILNEMFEQIVIIYILQDLRNFRDLKGSIRIYKDGLKMFKVTNNFKGIYLCGYHLGLLYMQLSQFNSAALTFETCLEALESTELKGESIGRVISCISLAYIMSGQLNNLNKLFRSFDSVLTGEDLKTQLLCECDYLESEGFPLRNLIQVLQLYIDKEQDSILLTKYYYYKALMYKQDTSHRQSFKFLNKALYSGPVFDPRLRVMILKEIRNLMIMYEWEVKSVDNYLSSLQDVDVNVVFIIAMKISNSEVYQDMIRCVREFKRKGDRMYYNACRDDGVHEISRNSRDSEIFSESDECALYDAIAFAISNLNKLDQKTTRNSWVVILTEKQETNSLTSINELITFNSVASINYLLLSDLNSTGLEAFLDRSSRSYRSESLSSSSLYLSIKYLFSMRYDKTTFISERFLYSSHLI